MFYPHNRNDWLAWLQGMLAFASIPIFAGVGLLIYRLCWFCNSIKSTGTITDLTVKESEEYITHSVEFVYPTVDENIITAVLPYSTSDSIGEVGDAIDVLYLEGQAESVLFDSFLGIWGMPMFFQPFVWHREANHLYVGDSPRSFATSAC